MQYDAFISYSRAADDDLAPDLQRSLERLSRPWYRRKPFLRILRDTTSFGASADLNRTIATALDESEHLILLVSPESARSPWTTQEVAHWLGTKGPDSITTVITGWAADDGLPPGELTDLNEFDWKGPDVPPALRAVAEAPLAVDLRWADGVPARRTLADDGWLDAIAQIAAGVKGIKKDELIGELVALKTKARILTTSVALGVGILLATAVAALVLWIAADRERDAARSEAETQTSIAAEATAEAERQTAIADDAKVEAETQTSIAAEARDEAELQTAIASVRSQANSASRLIGTDVTGALREALDAIERAREVTADFPDAQEPTGELQARGVVLEALMANPDLVANIDGRFGWVEATPDGGSVLMLGEGGIWRVGAEGSVPAEPTWFGGMAAPMLDGRILVGEYDELKVFGADDGIERRLLLSPDAREGLRAVAVGPHGRFVAGAGDAGTVFLWDLDDDSDLPLQIPTGVDYVTDLSFHSGSARDAGVLAWSGVSDGDRGASAGLLRYDGSGSAAIALPFVAAFEHEEVNQIAFAPGCGPDCMLVATSRATRPSVLNVSLDGSVRAESLCAGCEPGGEAIAWHGGGTRLAYGDSVGGVEIWELEVGEWIDTGTRFEAPRGQVISLAFLGHDVLAATFEPGAVSRWRTARSLPLARGAEPAPSGDREWDALQAVTVQSDGEIIATGGSDAVVRLWRVGDGGAPEQLSAWGPWCGSECGRASSLAGPASAATCQLVRGDRVADLAFAPPDLLAAAGSHGAADCTDPIVRVFELDGDDIGRPVELPVPDDAFVYSVAFDGASCGDRDGCLLLAAGAVGSRDDGQATIWGWRRGAGAGEWTPAGTFVLSDGNGAWVHSIRFGEIDGRSIVQLGTSYGGEVWLRDDLVDAVERGRPDAGAHRLPGDPAEMFVAEADPAGRGLVLSGGGGGELRLHAVEIDDSGRIAARLSSTFARFEAPVRDATWTPDGEMVVAVSDDGTIRIFDVTVPTEPVAMLAPIRAHAAQVWQVAMHPDGSSFFAVSHPGRDDEDIGTLVRWIIGGDELTGIACQVARSVDGSTPAVCR